MPITIDGSNGITQAGEFNSDSSFGFKNRIINGAMVIDQRNAGASVTPTSGQFTVDRWQAIAAQTSKYSVQQSSTAPTGFNNSVLVTSLSAYSVLSTDSFALRQLVEGYNFADCNWGTANAKTVTLSFWVRSSLTGTFGGSFANSDLTRSYPFTYTISVADTWEQKSVTVAGDTTGTWVGATNGRGVIVWFGLGAGSTLSGTAGVWAGADYRSATGATSVVGTNGATFYITGVQLEVGSTATSFDYRPYGTELALCQRYYQKYPGQITGTLSNNNGSARFGMIYYKVTMRANATISATSGGSGSVVVDTQSTEGNVFYFSGATASFNSWVSENSTYSAEL